MEDIRLDGFVSRELINQLQVKYQTRLLVIALWMNFRFSADMCNLNQIDVFYTFSFDVRHKIEQLIERNRGREVLGLTGIVNLSLTTVQEIFLVIFLYQPDKHVYHQV